MALEINALDLWAATQNRARCVQDDVLHHYLFDSRQHSAAFFLFQERGGTDPQSGLGTQLIFLGNRYSTRVFFDF